MGGCDISGIALAAGLCRGHGHAQRGSVARKVHKFHPHTIGLERAVLYLEVERGALVESLLDRGGQHRPGVVSLDASATLPEAMALMSRVGPRRVRAAGLAAPLPEAMLLRISDVGAACARGLKSATCPAPPPTSAPSRPNTRDRTQIASHNPTDPKRMCP